MMPWRTWLVRLGVSGALAIAAGCGSGDVPDPSSDSQAAADPAASGGGPQMPAGAAAPAPIVAPKVAARDEPESKPEEAKSDEATAEATPPPSGANPAPDKNSATAEMLAMATGGAPARIRIRPRVATPLRVPPLHRADLPAQAGWEPCRDRAAALRVALRVVALRV